MLGGDGHRLLSGREGHLDHVGFMTAVPVEEAVGWTRLAADRPAVMGIINVTPDSFSDGGDRLDPTAAIAAGLRMAEDGAAIVDVGGESTRPGAEPVDPTEEQRRILPVTAALARAGVTVSVDTRNAVTMRAALDVGATILNDVSGFAYDPAAADVARGHPVIVMHMRGTPQTMQVLTDYADVAADVRRELAARLAACRFPPHTVAVDPGIGFSKGPGQNEVLLAHLPTLLTLGCPIVVGVSRKGFIGRVTGVQDRRDRLAGSLAAALFALERGASVLRVHDVPETVQAVRTWQALRAAG